MKEDKQPPDPGQSAPAREKSADERWNLVQRVTQDESFRRAPRLRELLLHITSKALDGRSMELNEYEIALTVFRRTESFNSADDSIVRSSARQLRTKLHEYFEGPGRDEPLIIDIPKGSYVPEFPSRAVAATQIAPVPVALGGRRWKAIAVVATAACLILAVVLIMNAGAKRAEMVEKPASLVSWLFGSPGQEVNVVLCDSALVVVNSYRPHILSLDEYIRKLDQEPLPLPSGNPSGATPPQFPGNRLITSFRDMVFVERIGALSAALGFRVALKHSRLMQVRDFRSGNHILLGSGWSNPWTTLFEERLNFRFTQGPEKRTYGIGNTNPQSGEQSFYQCTPAQAHDGVSYARIAIVPNLSGQDSILLISGIHTESSEGALDSALSPQFLTQVQQISNARKAEELNGVELLLEVRAVDGVVRGTRLIASRVRK